MTQKKLPLINSAHGSETRNIINELIKLFNGMGYTYNESLQKAQDILDEAQQTNDMNESVQQQINTLIAESGTSDAEVLQARIDAEGNEYPVLKDRLDESDAQLEEIIQDYAVTVTVGTGGDYTTVNDAIEALSKKSVKYKTTGLKVEIKLLSGFVMAEQVYVENIDLGFITITSEDAEVIVDATNFSNNVSEEGYGTGGLLLESGAVFTGYGNAVLPTTDVLFNLNKSGTSGRTHGLVLIYGATGRIGRKKGFINGIAMGVGIYEGSRLYATDTIIKDNGGNNLSVFRGAYALFRGSVATGAGGYGAYLDNLCSMDSPQADFSGAGESGIWASASSLVSANGSNISNCAKNGVLVDNTSLVDLHGSTIDNSGRNGIQAIEGCIVTAKGSSIKNSGNVGVICSSGSKVVADESTITGSNNYSVYANLGGEISINNSDAQKVEGVDGNDIRINYGGTIHARDTLGGLMGTDNPNTLGANGIIYNESPHTIDTGYTGSTSDRVVWGIPNHDSTGSSTIPLPYANLKNINITRINIVEGGDLTNEELNKITIAKNQLGFSLYVGVDESLSNKLSQTSTKVYFTVTLQ